MDRLRPYQLSSYGMHPRTYPMRALRVWLDTAGISTEPLFRNVAKGGRMILPRLARPQQRRADHQTSGHWPRLPDRNDFLATVQIAARPPRAIQGDG